MKEITATLVLILIFTKTFACSCEVPKPILEFYSAQYVFEGKVASKKYSSDSLTYTIKFNISKHYKNGDKPETLEFNFKSEGKYTGVFTSCDWNVKQDENWIVYAHFRNDKLTFGFHCSNSKPIDWRMISEKEQKVLDNGNSFKLDKYIYFLENGFNNPQPVTNVDSIIKLGKIKNYEKPHSFLRLLIDKNGNLIHVTTIRGYKTQIDSNFNLPTKFEVSNSQPLTEFQKDAIELVSKISTWEIKRHKVTNTPVTSLRGFSIAFDNKTKKWKYEL
jgi:hypothetical protein